ncbi:hypothetical protein ACVW0J_007924 [Bradyrhizobium sp. i1.7.7]
MPGVIDVERLRLRMVGATTFIDTIAKVPRTYPIDRVEEIKRKAQAAVDKAFGDADLTFTAVPVARDNETVRDRIMVIAHNSGLAIHHVTVHDLGAKLIVGIDLEVDAGMQLDAAHDIANTLERSIQEEFGADVEVDVHIEPLEPELPFGVDAVPERVRAIASRPDGICRRRRDLRHPQCACPQHRRRRDRQFPLPCHALDERDQGARACRRDRARAAPRVPGREARDQPRRATAGVTRNVRGVTRSRFGLATHVSLRTQNAQTARWIRINSR